MSKSERSTVLSLSDSGRVVDPLLKDLDEKKQTFRRNVVSIAAELKDVRTRLASQEQSVVRETLTRKEAETKAKNMEYEIHKLEKKLEDRNNQLEASALAAEKYLKDLDDLRSQLAMTKETAETSAASAQSAQLQCRELAKELGEKTCNLKEHEERVTRLGQQLDDLQRDLRSREFSQKQLKDEVLRVENEMMQAVANAGSSRKDCEFSPKNLEMINELLVVKDEEIGRLRDEIRIMSGHWKIKTKEMEAQLEKQRRADQELKKKVLKLEFCLQEARSQTRKLQRMGERRDKAIRELKEQLAAKERKDSDDAEKPNFWETSSFKIVVSMSMLVLVMFSKR